MTKGLDLSQIASLLEQDNKREQERKNAQIRRKVFPTEPRTYENWFRLPTRYAECTNSKCIDPRKKKPNEKTMVAEVNGGEICRYCFLEGVNKVKA